MEEDKVRITIIIEGIGENISPNYSSREEVEADLDELLEEPVKNLIGLISSLEGKQVTYRTLLAL